MTLSIGELAQKLGVSVRVVRHYDNHDLLKSTRGNNGYRYFNEQAITQVRQIQRFIALGFSVAEICSFPDCMRLIDGAAFCPETQGLQKQRLDKIEMQISDLEEKKAALLKTLMQV
ncbi:MerR family transcriptional regulator [Acinetobacter sichuanensis]|uniref:MerR family transcriptional regulator n=1 Tax=Acinetobacter sichuanensis TaxID=2136183 RepID=A0A371YPS3_9GAMM|nr:MerR family transcriptional regulator [Acinetobacter sichuanensis]RFC83469.1 MerR family transcriptional regulator [Acinetobacter sichuanensis]